MLQTLKTTYNKPLTASQIESKPKTSLNNRFKIHESIELECGEKINGLTISYSTYGQLNKDNSNVIWVCHALTADANPKDWWPGLVGENDLYNPKDFYIVCANLIGSNYGSTSPINCASEHRYDHFPQISIRDNVMAFDKLRQFLGIKRFHTLIGGSMGGQQAMEWAILDNQICENLVLLATNAVMSPWAIALNQSQRLAIEADKSWGSDSEDAGASGLKAARSIALLSYRNNNAYNSSQKDKFDFNKSVKAISYQNYQGEKLVNRFNAYSYYALTKTMDSHDVSRDRESISKALNHINAKTLVIALSSDLLFPLEDSQVLAKHIANSELETIDSEFGHDGFLIETQKISSVIQKFYKKHEVNENKSGIALIGFGCVGQGVYDLVQQSQKPNIIKSIVIKNEFKARKSGHHLLTTDHCQIFQNKDIKTVVEVINNPKQAYNVAKLALKNSKNLITANKKMVAQNLAEIIDWTKQGATILYESAVAGSIPIIRTLDTYFDHKMTDRIRAIVNGSSNYILTQMIKNNCTYKKALRRAQDLGFAELDPTDDVGGFDSKYKSVILAAHAFGLLCQPEEIKNFGIQDIQKSDIQFAIDTNQTIKLVADIKRLSDSRFYLTIMPEFIDNKKELAKVDNENNLVIVNNSHTDFHFSGAGAGSIATGTAVLADIAACENGFKYSYKIDENLTLSHDFNINVYINKSNLKSKVNGKVIYETHDYLISEINYYELVTLKLDNVFIAKINRNIGNLI